MDLIRQHEEESHSTAPSASSWVYSYASSLRVTHRFSIPPPPSLTLIDPSSRHSIDRSIQLPALPRCSSTPFVSLHSIGSLSFEPLSSNSPVSFSRFYRIKGPHDLFSISLRPRTRPYALGVCRAFLYPFPLCLLPFFDLLTVYRAVSAFPSVAVAQFFLLILPRAISLIPSVSSSLFLSLHCSSCLAFAQPLRP